MIKGKKIVIRQLELGDEEYLYKWWNDGEMMSHATHMFGTLQSKEAVRQKVVKEVEAAKMFSERKLFILCKKEGLEPIGEMSYHQWDARNQKCEFGIKICEQSQQNQGYGKDALFHFIDFLFRFLNLNKIELTTMADNERAQGLYKKLGFKEIGIIRDGYFDSCKGEFSDVVYMDLLKGDWNEVKNSIKATL